MLVKKPGVRKKLIVPYLAVGVAVLLLTACGGKEKEREGQNPPQSAASKEPVELTVWQTVLNVSEAQFMQEYGSKIKEKFPEVTLRFLPYTGKGSTVEDLLAAGQVPDIIYASVGHVFFGISIRSFSTT